MSSTSAVYRVSIPKEHKKSLADLIGLADEQKQAFLSALKQAPTCLSVAKLINTISRDKSMGMPREMVSAFVPMLASLMLTRYEYGWSSEKVATDVTGRAIAEAIGGLTEGEEAAAFEEYLKSVLNLDVPLGASAKVASVLIQHQHPFRSARIISDIRTVFSGSDDMKPIAAVIVHNLQIRTLPPNATDEESQIIALDTRDLRSLRDTIDRALDKEAKLKSIIERSDLEYVDA